jgi:two-component sensor histidine kinase
VVLLREIHHRVKNNLQVISSLLRLQARYVSDEQQRLMFLESQNRLESMVLTHELLYRSKDLAKIDLNGYINGLVNLLLSSFGISRHQVSFETDVAPVSMSVDTAIPCGLITNELVSNCLKHAFPEGRTGKVRIVLTSSDSRFQLIVSDDGIGLPPDLDFNRAQTLGLRLVHTLVKQLQGDVQIESSAGTEFAITFREVTSAKQS